MNMQNDYDNKTKENETNKKLSSEFIEEIARYVKSYEIENQNNLIALGDEMDVEGNLLSELNQRVKIFGMEHPYSIQTFNILGRLYSDRNDTRGMTNLLRRSLLSRIEKLGINHPDTLFTMNKLGRKLALCKEYEQAEQMFRKSLEGFNSLVGSDHSITIRCQNDLKMLESIIKSRNLLE